MPSRLYFVTDQSDSIEEESSLAGAETTGARLEDLFQSGNESSTSGQQEIQPSEEIEEVSSGVFSKILQNRLNKDAKQSGEKEKTGFRVRRARHGHGPARARKVDL